MQCPECRAEYVEEDLYCRQCGADLIHVSTTAIVPRNNNLPSVLYSPQLPRRVAAGVGALAVGVGIELLRRNLLARLAPAPRTVETGLPALRELLQPNQGKAQKLPKGYEVQETVVYMRRVIRRQG